MRIIIFFLFFIFMMCFISGLELVVSPEQLVFEGKVGEEICRQVDIRVDESVNIFVEDRWAPEGVDERKLSRHKLLGEELGFEVFYNSQFVVGDEEVLEVCLIGEDVGNFHGVLLFRGEDSPAGVGLWLVVNLEEGEGVVARLGSKVGSITGGAVGAVEGVGGMGMVVLVLLFIFIVLLEVFVLLRVRRKKEGGREVV